MRPASNLASNPSLPFKSPVSGTVVRAMMPTSAPTTPKRGKQRENPKAKKKSTLKKVLKWIKINKFPNKLINNNKNHFLDNIERTRGEAKNPR